VSRGEDFDVVHRLYAVVVLVVVYFSEDLMLNDLVLVRFDDFVRDG
jgi:hypothetical protein